jgi:hypothetical protein
MYAGDEAKMEQSFTPPVNTDIATIRINPAADPVVSIFAREAAKMLRFAETCVITDDTGVKLATDDLSIVSTLIKNVEATRVEYTGPINGHLDAVNTQFKTISEPLKAAKKNLGDKILAYKLEQRVKAEAIEKANDMRMEAARIEAAANGGEIKESVELTPAPSVLPKTVTSDIGSSSTRLTWHAKVVDFALLPDQYKLPNTSMLDFMARQITKTGKPNIPGVEFYQEESLSIKARG